MTEKKPHKPFRAGIFALLLLYAAPAYISVMVHDRMVDKPLESQRKEWYSDIVSWQGKAPDQYRVMPFQMSRLLQSAGVGFRASFLILRFVFLLGSLVFLHIYLRAWLDEPLCLAGGYFLAAVVPLTYFIYFFQESDLLNLFFFVAGYSVIRARKDLLLFPVLAVAMFNRETSILLVLVYFFYRFDELELKPLIVRSGLLMLTGLSVYFGLRKAIGVKDYYCDIYWSNFNLTHYETYLYPFLLTGPFVFLAFRNFARQPKFLRRAVMMIPFFLVIHWVIGAYSEQRLFLPLLPLLLPMGLISFSGAYPQPENLPGKNHRFLNPAFVLSFLLFIPFFTIFYRVTEQKHVLKFRSGQKARAALASGIENVNAGRYREAEEHLLRAHALSPDDAETNYTLGALYARFLPDRARAERYLDRAGALDVRGRYAEWIEKERRSLKR